jgi:hypothetical protein
VEAPGGDQADAEDLLDVWERVHGDKRGRVDRMRYEAEHSRPNGGVVSLGTSPNPPSRARRHEALLERRERVERIRQQVPDAVRGA